MLAVPDEVKSSEKQMPRMRQGDGLGLQYPCQLRPYVQKSSQCQVFLFPQCSVTLEMIIDRFVEGLGESSWYIFDAVL